MVRLKYYILLLLLFLINGQMLAKDPTVDEIIRNVQKKFDKVPLVFAEFLQTFHWSVAEQTQEFMVQIYIGKNNEFRTRTNKCFRKWPYRNS